MAMGFAELPGAGAGAWTVISELPPTGISGVSPTDATRVAGYCFSYLTSRAVMLSRPPASKA